MDKSNIFHVNIGDCIDKYYNASKCDRFIFLQKSWDFDGDFYKFAIHPYNKRVYFNLPKTIDSINNFKQWLSKNPITVYYQLVKPVEEDAPADIIKQLKALHLNENTTIITSNVPISFKYQSIYKELRLSKLAAVQAISDRKGDEVK